MTSPGNSAKALVLSALLLALTVVGLGVVTPAQGASADPMKMVPSNSLFCVRINSLDATLGQTDMFLAGVSPIGVSMLAKAQLGQLLGSADLKGLDTAGSFALFGPLPGGAPDPTRIGLLVPVSDYQQFLSGNTNVSDADAQGISQIGPAGSPMMAVTQVGDFALVSTAGNGEALVQAKTALSGSTSGLAGTLDATTLKQSSSAPVWAYANVKLAGQMFGPMVQAKIQEAKGAIAAMNAQGQAQPGMAQAEAAMDMYATILDTLLKETQFISLSLQPSAASLRVAFTLASAPGTGMADMLKGQATKKDNKLLGYLQDGAAMSFAGSMESPFWAKLNQAYLDLLPKLLGPGASGEAMSQIKKMAADATDALGGSIAGSFSVDPESKPPFEVTYVADLKDAQKWAHVMDQAAEVMAAGPIADFYKSMGVKMDMSLKRNVDNYKGVAIDSVVMTMEPTDADSPQAQMVTAMYGGGLTINLAVVDNLLVYALAKEPGPAVKKLIDQVKADGPKQTPAEIQTAMGLIPDADKADFFATANALRFMKMIAAVAPIPLPDSAVPSRSNMAVAGNVGDGKVTVELAVPKQHVLEIMGVVMQMQQQGM